MKNRLLDYMSITMHGTSIFSNPVYISLYFPPSSRGTYQCCFLHYPTHTLNNADLTLTMPVLFDMFLEKTKLKDDSSNDANWIRDLRIILVAAQKNYVLDAP